MTSRCPCTLSSTSDFCFSAVLLSVLPPDLLYLQLFLCAGLTYSFLALHGFSCTACRSTRLCFIYLAPIGNKRSHKPGVYSLLRNLRLKHSPHVEALGVSGEMSCFLEGRNLEPAPGRRLEVICFDWSRNDRETEWGCRGGERSMTVKMKGHI